MKHEPEDISCYQKFGAKEKGRSEGYLAKHQDNGRLHMMKYAFLNRYPYKSRNGGLSSEILIEILAAPLFKYFLGDSAAEVNWALHRDYLVVISKYIDNSKTVADIMAEQNANLSSVTGLCELLAVNAFIGNMDLNTRNVLIASEGHDSRFATIDYGDAFNRFVDGFDLVNFFTHPKIQVYEKLGVNVDVSRVVSFIGADIANFSSDQARDLIRPRLDNMKKHHVDFIIMLGEFVGLKVIPGQQVESVVESFIDILQHNRQLLLQFCRNYSAPNVLIQHQSFFISCRAMRSQIRDLDCVGELVLWIKNRRPDEVITLSQEALENIRGFILTNVDITLGHKILAFRTLAKFGIDVPTLDSAGMTELHILAHSHSENKAVEMARVLDGSLNREEFANARDTQKNDALCYALLNMTSYERVNGEVLDLLTPHIKVWKKEYAAIFMYASYSNPEISSMRPVFMRFPVPYDELSKLAQISARHGVDTDLKICLMTHMLFTTSSYTALCNTSPVNMPLMRFVNQVMSDVGISDVVTNSMIREGLKKYTDPNESCLIEGSLISKGYMVLKQLNVAQSLGIRRMYKISNIEDLHNSYVGVSAKCFSQFKTDPSEDLLHYEARVLRDPFGVIHRYLEQENSKERKDDVYNII